MPDDLKSWKLGEPRLDRSVTLQFIGDWGQANFHRICSWLCQEFCDRVGPKSRVGIWNTVHGGIDAVEAVFDGEVDLCLATPAGLLPQALDGTGMFTRPLPSLRALAVLPQNDKMVLAIDGAWGIASFAELRDRRPPLRIATSIDDGWNMIGHVAHRFMAAHGIDEATLKSWGGNYVYSVRPEQSLGRMRDGQVDAVLQEAIMTPGWRDAARARHATILAAEEDALGRLAEETGLGPRVLAAGYLPNQPDPLPALDFSDFAVVVRDDMPDDVAYLLTWCLVERRDAIERQFRHLPAAYSPLSYPLDPARMARPPLPLHPAAERYFVENGLLQGGDRAGESSTHRSHR